MEQSETEESDYEELNSTHESSESDCDKQLEFEVVTNADDFLITPTKVL